MKNYLIVGATGTGKTWIMKQLIERLGLAALYKHDLINYAANEKKSIIVTGKYIGDTFDGSDKLSMAVMKSLEGFLHYHKTATVIWEGDRFTNRNFIREAQPVVLKILGDGAEGRALRGSSQTDRQIKSIATRVNNTEAHHEFQNSEDALYWLLHEIVKT